MGVTAPPRGTQQQGWWPGGDLLQRLLLLLMAFPPFILYLTSWEKPALIFAESGAALSQGRLARLEHGACP